MSTSATWSGSRASSRTSRGATTRRRDARRCSASATGGVDETCRAVASAGSCDELMTALPRCPSGAAAADVTRSATWHAVRVVRAQNILAKSQLAQTAAPVPGHRRMIGHRCGTGSLGGDRHRSRGAISTWQKVACVPEAPAHPRDGAGANDGHGGAPRGASCYWIYRAS